MFYHTGSTKAYQLHFLLFGVEFIAVSCYENIENRLPVCQFLICIYWFYSILSVMVDYKYLKMICFQYLNGNGLCSDLEQEKLKCWGWRQRKQFPQRKNLN